jgi:hypothetical protein
MSKDRTFWFTNLIVTAIGILLILLVTFMTKIADWLVRR